MPTQLLTKVNNGLTVTYLIPKATRATETISPHFAGEFPRASTVSISTAFWPFPQALAKPSLPRSRLRTPRGFLLDKWSMSELSLEEQIVALNELPELTHGLTPPINVDEMNWHAFQERSGASDRQITYVKLQLQSLQPRSMRQLAYMVSELFMRPGFTGSTVVWALVGALLNMNGQNVRVSYMNYKRFREGNAKAKGRPKMLTEEQVGVVFAAIDESAGRKAEMSNLDIQSFIHDTWNIDVSRRFVQRLLAQKKAQAEGAADHL